MKILNKILIIPLIVWCLVNIVSADNSDCWIFATKPFRQENRKDNWFQFIDDYREKDIDNFFLTKDEQKEIITKADLNIAILNLKKYCCDNNLWWLNSATESCTGDNSFYNENVVDSRYLFDHLFDVVMRRLNWLTWDTNIYQNMTTDELWTKRRKFVKEEAENLSWSNPQKIIDEYNKYRTPSKKNLWYDIAKNVDDVFTKSNQKFLDYVSWLWNTDESKWVANAFKKYKEWTLYDRYSNACAITEFLYAYLDKTNSSDKTHILNVLKNGQCEKIIKDQIESENSYVSLITKKSSDLFLSNYINSYTSYLYSREDQLKKFWKDSTDRFLDVVRAVPHLVKECTR